MSLLRQIKELKAEYEAVNAHILRQVIQVHGCVPESADPKKPWRRILLPGWLIIGGLPSTPSHGPDAGHFSPEPLPEEEDVIA
jgi:hypothetical protein